MPFSNRAMSPFKVSAVSAAEDGITILQGYYHMPEEPAADERNLHGVDPWASAKV